MGIPLRDVVASTDGFLLEDKGPVWTLHGLGKLLNLAENRSLVILGCDIITLAGEFTYDNWFFSINQNKPLLLCSAESIQMFKKYIGDYINKHGEQFLFSVVIYDLY